MLTVEDRRRLEAEKLAIEFHSRMEGGDGEYGCPGLSCPRVQKYIELLLRFAAAVALPDAPKMDVTNHHNALACPYCNPDNLTLAEQPPIESMRAIQQHQRGEVALPDAPAEEEHDPLCSEGVKAGDQTMPCDCHLSRLPPSLPGGPQETPDVRALELIQDWAQKIIERVESIKLSERSRG